MLMVSDQVEMLRLTLVGDYYCWRNLFANGCIAAQILFAAATLWLIFTCHQWGPYWVMQFMGILHLKLSLEP